MFFVFNKSKIYSYLIALSTVFLLFVAVSKIGDSSNAIVETSTNYIDQNCYLQENITKNEIIENSILNSISE